MRIKTGDKVIVIKGRDRGKTGVVSAVNPETNRIKIDGLNIMKRHARSRGNTRGGIIEVVGGINAANVMLLDPATSKPTRIGYQTIGDKKARITKQSKTVIEDAKK